MAAGGKGATAAVTPATKTVVCAVRKVPAHTDYRLMYGRMAHVSRLAFEPPPQIVKDCSMSMGCIKCGFLPAQDPVLSISATAREQLFHHSRENVLPTEVEILETKANITVERSAIKLLKQRISELQQEVEIRELNLEHYRTIIPPIQRIPNEILGSIFQDAVDDAVTEMSSAPFDQRVPPWPLA
ncbi:hypothetical protein C8J56DRAFT_1046312 [Mycena floridula]|nr:hypothetical protein C8J56DRAFT_1046312 [Mycena floridula]